jgi:hypothetical protein
MDLLLRADLRADVDAFVGRGKVQEETAPNGIVLKWSGWPTITQIYLPALSKKRVDDAGRRVPAALSDVLAIMAVGAPTRVLSRQLYERP